MRTVRAHTLATLLAFLAAGCGPAICPPTAPPVGESVAAGNSLYVGGGDPYLPGELHVRTVSLARCEQGAPVPLIVHSPEQPGRYAVVQFHHGFILPTRYYSEILRHLASHGFVVVAPQMYPADSIPLGKPTAAEEAAEAIEVMNWVQSRLSEVSGVSADTSRLGLAGHSRGGKVAWTIAARAPERVVSIAGLDPVDGTGGPMGGQDRVVQGPGQFNLPSLVVGLSLGDAPVLGSSCAPAGDNHLQFYEASGSPAWHVIALGAGHQDLMDADRAGCGLPCRVCPAGEKQSATRILVAGLMSAFFRGSLQGDADAFAYLSDVSRAPMPVVMASR